MYQKFLSLLNQETFLLKAAVENEKEKRRSILSANGAKLKILTEKTEVLLEELRVISEQRMTEAEKIVMEAGIKKQESPVLSDILKIAENSKDLLLNSLKQAAASYRDMAAKLKAETDENRDLILKANQSIEEILSGIIQKPKTYTPEGRMNDKKFRESSVLLNANA